MKRFNYPFVLKVPEQRAVLRRLGYTKHAKVNAQLMSELDDMMLKAGDICRPRAMACVVDIVNRTKNTVTLENGVTLEAEKLAALLKNSEQMLLMGSTLGQDVVDRINKEIKQGDPVFAVVLDAYASECVDDVFDYIVDVFNTENARIGLHTTKHRFSAGYGGLDISNQKTLFDTLDMQTLGVAITETFMLYPEKSVIAMAGLEKR